ncbi:MAG: hypothetical protein ABL984_16785, partial [Pyrinomonadaceae bacterium]
MNRIKTLITVVFLAAFILSADTLVNAQNPPAPTPKPLPPGMKGADAKDPRASLKSGLFDAGEAASGIKHVSLSKKPAAFDVGTDPSAPVVSKALSALGVPDPSKVPLN